MNFSDFKKLLGADPRNQDPGFLAARQSGPEFLEAAREAEAFEQRLDEVVRFPVDTPALLEAVLEIPLRQRRPPWLGIAASVLAVAGAAALYLSTDRLSDPLPEYLAEHYRFDGAEVLALAGDPSGADTAQVLAQFDLTAAPALAERIGYIKLCPSLSGMGAHMIVRSADGWVTVFYLPGVRIGDGLVVPFEDHRALMLGMPTGALAIIDSSAGEEPGLATLLRDSLVPMSIDA